MQAAYSHFLDEHIIEIAWLFLKIPFEEKIPSPGTKRVGKYVHGNKNMETIVILVYMFSHILQGRR